MLRGELVFEGRALGVVAFVAALFGLVVLDRSGAGLFSTFVVGPGWERRPIDAFVGDVERLMLVVDICLSEATSLDVSTGLSKDTGVLFVIELKDALAFRLDFAVKAALPVVAGRREVEPLIPFRGLTG